MSSDDEPDTVAPPTHSAREKLKQIVECSDTPAGRTFDWTIQALIFVSLISFSLETLPNLSAVHQRWLYIVEAVTVAIFTIEYVLRIILADNRLGFLFSFWGVVDLMAILPFYISHGLVDLRGVRILRMFRLFRILKLARYSNAIARFERAVLDVREELIVYLAWAGMMIFLASVGIYYFEAEAQPEAFGSVFHSMWWSVVTLTTVGYGDAYPVTLGCRIFTGLLLVVGIGMIAVPSGLFAASLNKVSSDKSKES